jgi:AAA+ superfamily predicted ATPase
MADAEGITCITTSAYALDDDDYVTELYELANDLSPCIVFIEDIDLIGQNREEFGYQKGSALLSLLAVMDGIEERKEIVTVATTNCFDTLDKALSQRPSRFDRVIKLCRPSLSERRELVSRLCQKIPLDESTQDYISHKSDGCTPAQLQEIVFSLAIEYAEEAPESGLHFCEDIINHIISRINGRNGHRIGFGVVGDHNGCNSDLIHTTKLI